MPSLHSPYMSGCGHKVVGVDSTPNPNKGVLKGTTYKTQAMKAAKDLHYGPDVIEQIENAKNDREITRIMKTARKRGME